MVDLLLPATDGGVLAQVVALAVLGPVALAATWRHREVRTFVLGVLVMTAALMALRTVH